MDKVNCLYFPAQSGKTQRVKDSIEILSKNNINFLITSNNILLVEQTSKRFDKSFDWTSENNINIKSLFFDISNDIYNMVVMCANKPRLIHLKNLIESLENNNCYKKINIWIDEADSNINLWNIYSDLISKDIINKVTLISATFDSIFKKYTRLNITGFKETYHQCYRCLKDSIINQIDFVGGSLDYIINIFEENPKLIVPGSKAFIPGNFFKESHDSIADLLVTKYNFVVLIINGTRKQFLIPGKKSISFNYFDKELKDMISKIYYENKFYNYPFAITGLECIKRGITFQSSNFLFDYGIIQPIFKKVEVYQLMARLFGNIGDFPSYKPCKIFSTPDNFNKVKKQESIAINIAKIVYKDSLKNIGKKEINDLIKY